MASRVQARSTNTHNLGNALYFIGKKTPILRGGKIIIRNLFVGDIKIIPRFLVSFEITA